MKCNSLYCRILALCSLLALVAGTTGVLFSAGPPQLLVLTLNSSLSPSAARLLAGTSSSLTATLVTGEHSKDVTRLVRDWSSSNPAVATVDSQGHVTAGSVGTTTITATLGGAVSASLALAVTSASPPVFQVQPSATGVSAVITPGVVVSVQDNLGDPLAGLAVTMSIGTNPSGKGILTGTVAQTTNSAGTATFSDVRIDWLGSGHTLVATVTTPTTPVFSISNPFDETRVGDPCLGPNSLGNANPVCTLAGLAACPSRTSDGLNDAWKIAGGIDLNGDGVIDAQHDLLLPGADLNKPDIYLQYDWMGYGPMETPCNNNLDCTSPYLGLKGATCSGPALTQGFAASCVLACSTDFDCTSKGLSHLTDRCGMANGIQQCLHTHDPALLAPDGSGGSEALGAVAAKFAEHGINLHVVRGQAQPHSHVVSFNTLAGPSPITNACEGGSVGSGTAGAGLYAESIYDLKSRGFDSNLNQAYHYAIFGHYSTCDSPAHCSACGSPLNTDGTPKVTSIIKFQSSGISEFFGNDFIVSLANFIDEKGNPPDLFNVGGTFMHELGHNFGLHHGGGFDADGAAEDTPDFKPNYLSVMNYNYQFVGIPEAGGRRLDYSTQALPAGTATPGILDENGKLDEPAGLGSGDASLMFFYDAACAFRVAATQGPVDWDGDGVAGDNVAATADLDPYDHICGAVTNRIFRGHVDWPPNAPPTRFTYRFQCTSLGLD